MPQSTVLILADRKLGMGTDLLVRKQKQKILEASIVCKVTKRPGALSPKIELL